MGASFFVLEQRYMVLRVGILTVSDRVSRGEMEDLGGSSIESVLDDSEFDITRTGTVPDEEDLIATTLLAWCDEKLDVILTTGGTGSGATRRHAGRNAADRDADRPGNRRSAPYRRSKAHVPRNALARRGRDPGYYPHRQPAGKPERRP